MSGTSLRASVILPTHGRRRSLVRVLQALARQTIAVETFEVVVICDGDIDGSAAAAAALVPSLPYSLRVVVQANQGPGAARNCGVAAAAGSLLVFLDDDVVPDAALLATHLDAHAGRRGLVTIGPLLPPTDERLEPWGVWEERMLCRQYTAMQQGKWAPTYRQFYTGNAAVLRDDVRAAGGFDEHFRRAEDVELALRLRELGLHFAFLPSAIARHYIHRSFAAWRHAASAYGVADVDMSSAGRPELLQLIAEEFAYRHRAVRLLIATCAGRPAPVRVVEALLSSVIHGARYRPFGAFGQIGCSLLFNLAYYHALAGALGGRAKLMALLHGEPDRPPRAVAAP